MQIRDLPEFAEPASPSLSEPYPCLVSASGGQGPRLTHFCKADSTPPGIVGAGDALAEQMDAVV